LRSALPQQGHRPSSQNARVASARSQWPRASHCGLMHCTVKPGRNCILFSLSGRDPKSTAAVNETQDPPATDGLLARIVAQLSRGVKPKGHNM
jgi:hypothetical protein